MEEDNGLRVEVEGLFAHMLLQTRRSGTPTLVADEIRHAAREIAALVVKRGDVRALECVHQTAMARRAAMRWLDALPLVATVDFVVKNVIDKSVPVVDAESSAADKDPSALIKYACGPLLDFCEDTLVALYPLAVATRDALTVRHITNIIMSWSSAPVVDSARVARAALVVPELCIQAAPGIAPMQTDGINTFGSFFGADGLPWTPSATATSASASGTTVTERVRDADCWTVEPDGSKGPNDMDTERLWNPLVERRAEMRCRVCGQRVAVRTEQLSGYTYAVDAYVDTQLVDVGAYHPHVPVAAVVHAACRTKHV